MHDTLSDGARLRRWFAALLLAGVAWSVLLPLGVSAQAVADAWSKDLGATIYSVAASVDGGTVVAGRRDNIAIAFDTTGKELWQVTTNGSVYGVAISDDGVWAATASEGRRVLLLQNGQQVWEQRGSQTFTSAAITKDGGIVAAGSEDRKVYVFDRAGDKRWEYSAADAVIAVALYGGEGGFRALAGTRDSRVTLLGGGDGAQLWQVRLSFPINALAVTPDGRHIAVGDREGNVYLLDGVNGNQTWTFDAGSRVQGVGISADGQTVAAGTTNGELVVLRADGTPAQRQTLGATINALTLARGRADLVLAENTALTFAGGGAGTYAITSPPSKIIPIVSAILAALVVIGAVVSLVPWRGERGYKHIQRHSRTTGRQIWRARLSYLFLLPTVALLVVFNYYPAFSGIVHAFTVWKPGVSTEWVGLQNFRALVADRYLWIGTWNAVILIITGFLKLLMPLLVAELIFHLRNDLMRYVFRTLFVLPLIVPGVVGVLLWVNIYDPNIGLANQTLRSMGLENMTRVWLGDASTALWAIVFMGFPWISAFALLIFYGGLISIPGELFDAAKVDGASGLRTFWSIHIPLLLGQIRLLLILGFIAGVQEFSAVYLTTGGGPGSATYVPALELYYQAVRFNNFGLASAIGAVLFLIIMAGTIINLRYVKSSVEYSA